MEKALILFAHGARDPAWAGPVQAVAKKLQTESPDLQVGVAFLEFMTPTLSEAVAGIVARAGNSSVQVDVLPFFIAQGGHLREDLPVMLTEVQKQHAQLQIRLLPALGELPSVQDAMAQAISRLL